jgi:serine/threonine protein phosphatase PrpC
MSEHPHNGKAAEGKRPDGPPVSRPRPYWNLVGLSSNIGMKRKVDEDSVVVAEIATAYRGVTRKRVLLLVADGVGGHSKGDVASARAAFAVMGRLVGTMAEDRLIDDAEWQRHLKDAVSKANRDVLAFAEKNPSADGMGTTVVIALLTEEKAQVAWVGDSRVYRVRGSEITQLSKDHSLVQEMVDRGEITPAQAKTHAQRNVITRVVGYDGEVVPDTAAVDLHEDDILVVCCDGLATHVEDGEIAAIVGKHQDPQMACEELIALANKRGGSDNISVIVAPATITWW